MAHEELIPIVKNQLSGGIAEAEVIEFLRRRGMTDAEAMEVVSAAQMPAPGAAAVQEPPLEAVPVVQDVPVPIPQEIPSASEAHGVVRPIPPLQPSVPYSAIQETAQPPAAVPAVSGQPVPSGQSSEVPGQAAIFAPETPIAAPVGNKRTTRIIIAASVVGIILLGGGGLLAYNILSNSPAKVMARMFVALGRVRSGSFTGNLKMTIDSPDYAESASESLKRSPLAGVVDIKGPVTVTATTAGTVDLLDADHPKASVTGTVVSDKWPFGDFQLGAEYRLLEQVNYAKITAVPDLGMFSLSFLKNRWFMLPAQEAERQIEGVQATSSPARPSVDGAAIMSAVASNFPFRFVRALPSEAVDGVSAYHYQLAFDKDAYQQMIDAIRQARGTGPMSADKAKALNESLAKVSVSDVQIWVGKRDDLPHKLSIAATAKGGKNDSVTTDLSLVLTAKDFNKAADVQAPEGAQPFEQVMGEVFGRMMSATSTPAATSTSATADAIRARNTRRAADVASIAGAIRSTMAANKGAFPCGAGPLPIKPTFLGASMYDIAPCIGPIPKDPQRGTDANSGYSVIYNASKRKITVRAPYAEGGQKISITK